jgi:hypothetical protein
VSFGLHTPKTEGIGQLQANSNGSSPRKHEVVRLPCGTAASRAPVEHVTSLPLLHTVYERGFELGGGVRTHTAADADPLVEFVGLVRSMAAVESVPLSGAELALISAVPTAPSKDDPDGTRKPRVAEIFDDEVQPQCDGGLALTSIRAPPGSGKTYLLKKLICRTQPNGAALPLAAASRSWC